MTSGRGKVLVAMSGGVDSSVAAALLLRAGYEVVGCFMRLGTPGEVLEEPLPADACTAPAKIGHRGCCSISDAADARLVAAELDIPLYICNFKKDFGRIIDYFVDEYAAGRTPNPCVRCNDWLKFGKLHDYARRVGASFIASGHYARVEHGGGEPRLLRALDRSKDQSYVLFGAPRARLGEMLLPIGGLEKPRVRELAREWGLPVFDKPDSQEICFVPDDDYAGLVERLRPQAVREGEVVNEEGRVLGRHGGQHRFTIGQRRGLSVSLGYPVYVASRDAESNRVTVGPREGLLGASCIVGEANWLVDQESLGAEFACEAKYRYNSRAVGAVVRPLAEGDGPTPSGRAGRFEVLFDSPQSAVAPGQALVLYDGDTVLGGGWITSVEAARRLGTTPVSA